MTAAGVENGDNFLLLRIERAGNLVGQQFGAFAQAGQRRFEFVRQVAQKLMPLCLQPAKTVSL